MPSIILECPYCGAEKIGFSIVFEHISTLAPTNYIRRRALMICSTCEGGVIGVFDKAHGASGPQSLGQCTVDPTKQGYRLTETHPVPTPSKIPEYLPDPLGRFYKQAADASKRGDWDASGSMSRKVIDVSTKMQLAKVADETTAKAHKTNFSRINALGAAGAITSDLQDWAHHVRVGGNDAAHDEEPFEKVEAEDLLSFTELYLVYVYTLPGRLRARRGLPPLDTPPETPPDPA